MSTDETQDSTGTGESTSHAPTAEVPTKDRAVPERNEAFWLSLQVVPHATTHAETKESFHTRTLKILSELTIGNLLYICDRLGVSAQGDPPFPQQVAWTLLHSKWSRLLIYLADFLRSHGPAVVQHYENRFPSSLSDKIQAEVVYKSNGNTQDVRPFTKLLAIYLQNPDDLESIHYRWAWRKATTSVEYVVEGGLTDDVAETLLKSIDSLAQSLESARPSENFVSRGVSRLERGLDVFLMHRHYPASVKIDYQNRFRVQHDYGRVVFGLDLDRSALVIKVGNKAIAKAIADWVKRTLDVGLAQAGGVLFSDYDPKSVARNILGGYDESNGIDLIRLEFKYSSLPTASPLAISVADHNRSIREELHWLREKEVLRLSSIAEIKSMTVRFEGTTTVVECESEKGGAVFLRIDDKGKTEDYKERLKEAFKKTFLIPLEQRIDPSMMIMGATEIYQYLLSGINEDQIRSYQHSQLVSLQQRKLIKEKTVKSGRCPNAMCTKGLRRNNLCKLSLESSPGSAIKGS